MADPSGMGPGTRNEPGGSDVRALDGLIAEELVRTPTGDLAEVLNTHGDYGAPGDATTGGILDRIRDDRT